MTSIRDELDNLAKAVMTRAQVGEAHLDQMTEALKVCATYYAICEKVKLKSGDEEPEGTFNAFQRSIHGANQEKPNGRPAQPPPGGRRDS